MSDLEDRLRGIVGASHVLVDPDLKAVYETDWTGRFRGVARCVIRPASTGEVAAVVQACSDDGASIVVQGGNTGLVGGGVPTDGGEEVVISLARLTELSPVEKLSSQVVVGAGVTLENLQQHARAAGLDFGVDLAARSSATVGGLIATNAGGIRVLRYGSMRQQLVGIEAVTARGEIISHLTGLAKDNTGFDLAALMCGSEGTLAVITKARLRLTPMLTARAVALVGVDGTAGALDLVASARVRLPSLSAAEIFYPDGLELVRAHAHLAPPLSASFGAYVLLEASAAVDPTDQLLQMLAETDAVLDATVASDAAGAARLWAYRESHTEAINAAGMPIKLDVCVPLPALSELVDELPQVVHAVAATARVIVFGHVNEGNLHVNVLGAGDDDELVTDSVLRLVARHHGSISSEHGVGRAKVAWLELSRTPAEIRMMLAIKAALDPDRRLNPGVLFA